MPQEIALIFDMDGVLVDSTAMHTMAWNHYLQNCGLQIVDVELRMLGKHNDDIVREFFHTMELSETEVFQHGANKEQLYRDIMSPVIKEKLVRGSSDFIARHKNLPLGLATNAEPANVNFVLGAAGVRDYFRAIVNGQEVDRPKPFPDIYLRAAELLGVPAEQCIVFEDSHTGVQAARAAGMRVVGFTTTVSRLDGVHLLVNDFLDPELDRWLNSVTSCA